jgi:hypothetical protein
MDKKEILAKASSDAQALEFHVVINSEGKYFRAKGFGGYGDTWVNDIRKAKVYPKIGQARSRVTWFANEFPKYPPPMILKFSAAGMLLLDEERQRRRAEQELEQATKNMEAAQERLREAKRKVKK